MKIQKNCGLCGQKNSDKSDCFKCPGENGVQFMHGGGDVFCKIV